MGTGSCTNRVQNVKYERFHDIHMEGRVDRKKIQFYILKTLQSYYGALFDADQHPTFLF